MRRDNFELILRALYQYGIREEDVRTKKYFTDLGFVDEFWNADDVPWCAAFVGWVLKQSNYEYFKTLRARDYISAGTPTDTPILGDLCIFWRGKEDDGVSGHVGFFIAEEGNLIYVLGGNQSDKVCITSYPKNKLIGYVMPQKA